MEDQIAVILASFLVVVAAYMFLSWREGNFVNVLFPFVLSSIPAYYLSEVVFLLLFRTGGSFFAYLFCFSMYAVGAVATVVGYLATPSRWVPILVDLPKIRLPGTHWIVLMFAVALYSPIMIEHFDVLWSPREIYMVTRSGYGVQYFLSTFLAYVALIVFLFNADRRGPSFWLFLSVVSLFIYLHGSKGQLLGMGFILLYFYVFVRQIRVQFGSLVWLSAAVGGAMVLLFYLTLPASMKQDLILGISSYSDYTRHAAQVIDDEDLEPQWGRLTLETSLLTPVPRALFPDKPKDFGELWLAERYYPEWFQAGTGAPAFGLGLEYADFNLFALPWYALTHLVLGFLLKLIVSRMRDQSDAGTFVLLLVLLGVPLVPTGSGFPFLLYYAIAHVVGMFCVQTANRSKSGTDAGAVAGIRPAADGHGRTIAVTKIPHELRADS